MPTLSLPTSNRSAARGAASAGLRPAYTEAFKVFRKTALETFNNPKDVALAHAACRGDLAAMTDQIAGGANPNALSQDRSVSMLAWAMECQGRPGFEALLKAGADPNTRLVRISPYTGQPFGLNMVTFAAGIALPDYLRLLLKFGGDPSSRQSEDTALGQALHLSGRDNFANYDILTEAGADPTAPIWSIGISVGDNLSLSRRYDKVADLLDRGLSYHLEEIAWNLQIDLGLGPVKATRTLTAGEMDWALKVKSKLEQRGLVLPLTQYPSYPQDRANEAARRAENAKKTGGLLLNP